MMESKKCPGSSSRVFCTYAFMPGKHGIFCLAFSRKPQNQGSGRSARNHSHQKLQAFLHISSSTKSVENFLLAFPGFSKFLENQESLDTPVFPGLFPGFSACAKKARNPRILVQNSTESQAPLAGEKTKREIIYYFK